MIIQIGRRVVLGYKTVQINKIDWNAQMLWLGEDISDLTHQFGFKQFVEAVTRGHIIC